MAPNGDDDWQKKEPTTGGDDWSTPEHEPPQDQVPQPYEGGPPAKTGGSGGGELESEDIIAMVITFFIPGIGQLLLGQQVKGLVILGLALFTCSGFGLIAVASLVDTYLVAKARKNREVGDWEFFPDFNEAFNL